MNSLVKCYEGDYLITLVFEKNLNPSSVISSNFTLSSGNVTEVSLSDNTVTINYENVTVRPLILNCTVEDVDGDSNTFSRIVAREFNYKHFNTHEDLCSYFSQTPDINLDGKIYYDVTDCNIYYDQFGQNLATDLNDFLLIYHEDDNLFFESYELNSGNCIGWMSPQC